MTGLFMFWLSTVVFAIYADQCTLHYYNNTLATLSTHYGVTMVAAADPSVCCQLCQHNSTCQTWSFSADKWTPNTPCHLSSAAPASVVHYNDTRYAAGGRSAFPNQFEGYYTIHTNATSTRQTIWGFGFEIQSDSIGSDNDGMPGNGRLVPDDDNTTSSAPHDLTPSERVRFASEMLTGFRYCRLAMGLFLRGLNPNQTQIQGRWPSQMAELKQMQDMSGIEGFAPEYWSPPPGWKQGFSYYSGGLNSTTDPDFLARFAQSRVADVQYLLDNGLKVPWWGLQNEPGFQSDNISHINCTSTASYHEDLQSGQIKAPKLTKGNSYSRCSYSQCEYYRAFVPTARAIKAAFPDIKIHANSARGQAGASPIASDPEARQLVDLWTWHFVNANGEVPLQQDLKRGSYGIPVANNEYEYQPGSPYAGTAQGFINTLHMIMNWMVFANSPTFYWIHALKPTTNEESKGYGIGYWRPPSDTNFSHFPNVKVGEWIYNRFNAHAVLPFAKAIPWESVRYEVTEDSVRAESRIFVFRTPDASVHRGPLHASTPANRFGVMMAHGKETTDPFTYNVGFDDGSEHVLNGYLYTSEATGYNVSLGSVTIAAGAQHAFKLEPLTMQLWVEW